ncbi:hypothetical protein FNH48_01415 [Salmonella enterica subsp. salamae]|nr:hypothetical protein [Salmonella enterica subsp. salamae]
MMTENACAPLDSVKTEQQGEKWTKWSSFTLKQQKMTIKVKLIAAIIIKHNNLCNITNTQDK